MRPRFASDVVGRAEITRTLAHGDRYLATRLLLRNGRIVEQLNAGMPSLENDWRDVGAFSDLDDALADLRRAGWTARYVPEAGISYPRLVALVALVAVITAVGLAAAGPLTLVAVVPVVIALVLGAASRWRQRERG